MFESLFPKHTLHPVAIDADGAWLFFDGALKTYFLGTDGVGNFTSRQIFKANNPHTGAGRESTATPPLHYHIYQTETFTVNSGVMCYTLSGTSGSITAGQSVTIPPGPSAPHTFWSDSTANEDLDVTISVKGGPNPGFDAIFVRNFYGYLSTCIKEGKPPVPWQMLAFMDHADVVLCDFPLRSGWLLNILLGRWLARSVGGYEVEYKIFEGKDD